MTLEIDVGSFLRRILFIDRQSTALAALKYQLTKLLGEKGICEKSVWNVDRVNSQKPSEKSTLVMNKIT